MTVSDWIKFKEDIRKYFKCDLCDYKREKPATLNKHNITKHTEQKCKVCNKEFKTSIEVVTHVAKEHNDQEKAWNVKFQCTPKLD